MTAFHFVKGKEAGGGKKITAEDVKRTGREANYPEGKGTMND
jgi:hypothetical protein